jgi:purine-binding chemotaxis protein CheW
MSSMARVHADQEQVHFLVFELGGQRYGVNVDQVEAVVEGEARQGRGCEGLWSYEGQDVPVQCFAMWIGLRSTASEAVDEPAQAASRILVGWSGDALRGFLVDLPRTIVTLPVDDIFPIPPLIRRVLGPSPLWGVGRLPRGLLLLVDLAARLDGEE